MSDRIHGIDSGQSWDHSYARAKYISLFSTLLHLEDNGGKDIGVNDKPEGHLNQNSSV